MKFTFDNSSGTDPVFVCPNCNYKTAHRGDELYSTQSAGMYPLSKDSFWLINTFRCLSCNQTSFWMTTYHNVKSGTRLNSGCVWENANRVVKKRGSSLDNSVIDKQILLYPENAIGIPPANKDLSDKVKSIYQEAASISNKSPRAAAALLRLALETFLKNDLKAPGETVNKKIANLYKQGIPENLEKIMDIIRITGNDAVHDGNIAVLDTEGKDNANTVKVLFEFINYLAQEKISMPNKLNQITSNFSEGQKRSIEQRRNS
ncbi:MAG: DUF4145 domain-containing protein [Liquorilactobacillus nagelii]|uniref:DUF4145 domain-containing protein n=1 Tax=Lactobacillaceae TaxID=33958 RepID=UPI0039E9F814